MKALSNFVFIFTVSLIFLLSSLTSCKTLHVNTDIPVTAGSITANRWTIQEARGVFGSKIFYYLRGGAENTQSFDDEYYKFNSDGTGSYHDNAGTNRSITWNFIKSDNSGLHIYFTNTPASFTVTWENIRIKGEKIYYDEYFTDGNILLNAHGQFIRIVK
jgi:hypothetical protein